MAVKRRIGLPHELLQSERGAGIEARRTHAQGQLVARLSPGTIRQIAPQTLANRFCTTSRLLGNQRDKFIAAQAPGEVRFAKSLLDAGRRERYGSVAFGVAEAVVDRFQAVQIGEEQ